MKRLFLLRHAKSSWKDASRRDSERPLAPRGIDACARLRAALAESPIAVDRVICSPATRTIATWEGVRAVFRHPTPPLRELRVYEATGTDLARVLAELPAEVESALLIGHNPGLEDLATRCIGKGRGKLLPKLDEGFKTGVLAELELPIESWSEAARGSGLLVRLLRPRDLPAVTEASP